MGTDHGGIIGQSGREHSRKGADVGLGVRSALLYSLRYRGTRETSSVVDGGMFPVGFRCFRFDADVAGLGVRSPKYPVSLPANWLVFL